MASSQPSLRPSEPLVPSGVLGMAIFLATELMFFAALVSAFVVLKMGSWLWPPPYQPRLPVEATALNTLVLLASGVTMQRAATTLRRRGRLVAWLAATAALGSLFLAVQGYEWVRLVQFGLTTSSSRYGATFYTIVGAHGLHVLVAVLALGVVVALAARGHFPPERPERFEPVRMYWFFVVGIWPVLYVLVYLA